MELLTSPLGGGGGKDRRGEFIPIEVSSDNCSYKDRYVIGLLSVFCLQLCKGAMFYFFAKNGQMMESFQNPIVSKTAAGR